MLLAKPQDFIDTPWRSSLNIARTTYNLRKSWFYSTRLTLQSGSTSKKVVDSTRNGLRSITDKLQTRDFMRLVEIIAPSWKMRWQTTFCASSGYQPGRLPRCLVAADRVGLRN